MGYSHGYAEVNGTRLFYESAGPRGSGLGVVVLIHGFTLDRRMWDGQVGRLARDYRVIRYDLRGFGKSALPGAEPYAHHEDLRALLAFLGIERAHVMGLSLGGAIAVNFAIAYPEVTRSLVAAGVSALEGFPWHEELARWFARIETAAKSGDIEAAKHYWLETAWFAPAHEQPGVLERLSGMVDDYSGWHFHHANPVRGLKPPANDRLGEIRAPALVIIGERDLDFYNHPVAERLAEQITGARKLVVPGAGHMVNMEAPEAFNRAILTFLEEVQ